MIWLMAFSSLARSSSESKARCPVRKAYPIPVGKLLIQRDQIRVQPVRVRLGNHERHPFRADVDLVDGG